MTEAPIPQSLAHDVAEALGPQWQLSDEQPEYNDDIHLDGPAGSGIYLSNRWIDDGRLKVGPRWPESCHINGQLTDFRPYFSSYGPNPTESPRITCALSRGGAAIAGDIQRRFLPEYFPFYDAMVQRKTLALIEGANRRELMHQLNQAAGGAGHISFDRSPPELHISDGKPTINGTVEATFKLSTYDGVKITAELRNLGMEQALAIIRLLPGRNDPNVP
jgi:hypothetical protein